MFRIKIKEKMIFSPKLWFKKKRSNYNVGKRLGNTLPHMYVKVSVNYRTTLRGKKAFKQIRLMVRSWISRSIGR